MRGLTCKVRPASARLPKSLVWMACLLLSACKPMTYLNEENLVRGARSESHWLSHGALCARLPSLESIDLYARELIPEQSALGRSVKNWDLSGLLDIFQREDGGWVILPSKGLKKLEAVHFRKGPSGENDALCFGRIWIEEVIEYRQDQPLGLENGVTVRFQATLKDPWMVRHFRNLKVESFDPSVYTLTTGVAFADSLDGTFAIDMMMAPTDAGWTLAKAVKAMQKVE